MKKDLLSTKLAYSLIQRGRNELIEYGNKIFDEKGKKVEIHREIDKITHNIDSAFWHLERHLKYDTIKKLKEGKADLSGNL